ncbi:ATP-dependent zinc metalloprotease FtsH [[Clostridium] polysaccharolyticum]|uniref:ATP-dependent zinc metalloprotease FtsH n=1 Tax=[Clostridium] polysaccharolyticum TaxID=29364 RepID=A0A1I0C698_9FIRM|nr:ATP-dependent zinc metalloprotease FtsH [[Clostridium] polysaccharolyticum]SET14629.1 cell division protease FtsH [[Clostridium] polysaccharolyticum]
MDNRMYNNNHSNRNRDNNNWNGNNSKNNRNGRNNPKSGIIICLILAIAVFMGFSLITSRIEKMTNIEIGYNEFISMLEHGEIDSIVLTSTKIKIKPKVHRTNLNENYYTGRIGSDLYLVERLNKSGVSYKAEIQDTSSNILNLFLIYVFPLLLCWVVFWFFYRRISQSGGGVMGVGKSNAKIYVEKETGVTFKDVAGQEEAKESMTELVDFLHNPGKYTQIGAKLPKGALLVGPPGTGKTLLAKAVAGEANVPFFSLSGSSFVEMFVGVGASRVRDLFKQAQQMAPCIVFIDEIDAIGKSRDSQYGGGNDEREQTLNQLLAEMDGFDTSKGLVVLAATNRPDVLDKALLRPGRFDRRIIVDKPDLKGRVDILKVHAKNVRMDETVDFEAIALATSGAVGSDLANMINEAAIMAVKARRNAVSQADLFEAVEVVIAGKEKKDRILGKEEKKIVASHEVGHALVAALQKNAEPVQKITIVPRTMGALGYVMQVPEEEKYLMSKKEMLTEITTFCGGRAAEEICFESVTSGASNDIEQATKLARAMVTQYGMSKQLGFVGLESVQNRYLDGRAVMNCSEQTAREIDKEVRDIIEECYVNAKKMLEENISILNEIAEYLYEKETITGKQFMEIFHRIKGDLEDKEEASERLEDAKAEETVENPENKAD